MLFRLHFLPKEPKLGLVSSVRRQSLCSRPLADHAAWSIKATKAVAAACCSPKRFVLYCAANQAPASLAGGRADALTRQYHPVLEGINSSTKWVVSAAAFAALVSRRDLQAQWCVLGSIFSSVVCKVLKTLVNEQRPPAARAVDPGMPSSHANSLAFFSTYVALAVSSAATTHSLLLAGVIMAAGLMLAWLRVVLGFHTGQQVAVGVLLGASVAAAWLSLLRCWVQPYLRRQPAGMQYVAATTSVFVVLFVVKFVRKWVKELFTSASSRHTE